MGVGLLVAGDGAGGDGGSDGTGGFVPGFGFLLHIIRSKIWEGLNACQSLPTLVEWSASIAVSPSVFPHDKSKGLKL